MATTETEVDELYERLQEFVGRGEGAPSTARDPVNLPMIRHWTDAIGDRNPIYVDEEAAAASTHGGLVAPPTMLQVWGMRGLAPTTIPADGSAPEPEPSPQQLLNEAGYTSVVATNCEQIYHRYLRPGDVLTAIATLDDISPRKTTGLGTGYFVTNRTTYRDQGGEVVGEMLFRILWYTPAARKPAAEEAPAKPTYPEGVAFFWEGIDAGELRIQRCASCRALRHPPRPMCPKCRSLERDFVVASGRGEVYSFVVHHHPQVPGREHPFAVALVELEEGTRIVGNVLGCDPADVHIGMPVQVAIEPGPSGDGHARAAASGTTQRRVLPQWRPR